MSTRLTVGDTAPDFTLPAADGSTVTLSDLRGKHVVVYFYPAAGTPGCTTEACDFRDSLASLQGAGYSVVGVSPDPVDKIAAFVEAEHLTFPLVSDTENLTRLTFGVTYQASNGGAAVYGANFSRLADIKQKFDPENFFRRNSNISPS